MAIWIWDRNKKSLKEEKVFGDLGVRFFYQTKPGYFLERKFFSKKPMSQLMGFFNNSKFSASRISSFVKKYAIPSEDFEWPPQGFNSFNDFFIRKFKSGKREFPKDKSILGSSAEGRLLIFPKITNDKTVFIKGQSLAVSTILKNQELAQKFEGGDMVVVRLCPVDYHRFHFPDSGVAHAPVTVNGVLHSVNPAALEKCPRVFEENERQVTEFKSDHCGAIAIVEVGALGVGKIIQSFVSAEVSQITRGQEKGYFLFGASTQVLFFQKDKIHFDEDLIENSMKGIETFVQVGERIGVSRV